MYAWERDKENRLVRKIEESTIGLKREILDFDRISIKMEEQVTQEKTLIEYFSPVISNTPSCIVLPQTSATHFELKPAILQLLPSFYGLEREDPYMHVKEFLEICSTFRFQNFDDESVRLRMFPFSLKDKAKAWLNSLSTGTITSWTQLVNKFLAKFFPMSKTDTLRREISDFCQKEGEQFYECWERFNDLLLKCPHHGFETWRLVKYFYDGLIPLNRQMIQSMHGGRFLQLNEGQAWESLESLSENSQHWNCLDPKDRKSQIPKRGGIYEVSDDTDMRVALASLTRKVEALAMSQTLNPSTNTRNEACALCTSFSHTAQSCPSIPAYQEAFSEQVNALHTYGKSSDSPFAPTYNPNWRNHPNFSWRQNQPPMHQGGQQFAHPNPYPSAPQHASFVPQQRKDSLEDTLQQFMQSTQQILQSHTQAISKLETHVGQLAKALGEREKGKFPSQPIPNPKGQFEVGSSSNPNEEVKSITTLRSGKVIDNHVHMPEPEKESHPAKQKNYDSNEKESEPLPSVHKAPYPQRLVPIKKSTQYSDILEVFKQVSINIPFLDAIKQVPAYAKFLKDLCTVKRTTNVPKKAFLTEQVSSIIQQRTPIKYKDPGCPTISCVIGDHVIDHALLDLGASVNLLPYSVYEKLGLGELKPTPVTLQLADRSVKIPRGVIEDVLIKVDKFYFPVDFIVLDTQPVENVHTQIPVILGRPFLATSNAIINCRSGILNLSFGNMTVELNVFNISRQPVNNDDLCEVNVIESVIESTINDFVLSSFDSDSLEKCLDHFNMDIDENCLINEVNSLLETAPLMNTDRWKANIDIFSPSESVTPPSIEKPPQLELKPLPDSLKYVFLGPSETLPVIIASDLDQEQEAELIRVLREHREANL